MAHGARLYPEPLIFAPGPLRSARGPFLKRAVTLFLVTEPASEYFNPTERIQAATERAIQENIRKLIATLHGLKR